MNATGHKRILIVDDEEPICELLKRKFEALNSDYQVVITPDGLAALAQFQQPPFELVVTDYEMPGMNGLELARVIRRLSPATRIVLMTSYSLSQLNGSVELEDLDGYVQKPFSVLRMFDVIEALVDR